MYGFHGRYLRIDLSKRLGVWGDLPEAVLRRFIGGVGLAAWLLHREAPCGIDPLAAESPLLFCFSPLVGTPLTTSAKFCVAAKSPLTDRFNDALSSSHFAIAGKKTGADALVITGACDSPSVLIIDDGRIRIEPASELWGMQVEAATKELTERLGPTFQTALIGPAGENLVRYATISHERRHAGRGGLGAVMGSKRLKAIAVRGSQLVAVADPAAVIGAAKDLSRRSFGPATAKYRELGTVANLLTFNRLNALPTRNFQQGQFDRLELLSGEELNESRRVARASCAACTIGCEHIYQAASGPVRLEYESLFALGPLCGIGERETVLEAARRCDDLGLDTISAGATIAFAMECAERGLLNETGLRFGNGKLQIAMLEQIAHRQGLGDLLADGTRRAAIAVGGDSADFAPHVKGLEIPGYEPRALQAMALGFAVGSRGADHNRSGAYEADFSPQVDRLHGDERSVHLAIESEDKAAMIDSLILCKFLRGVFTDLFAESAELLAKVTGWDLTAAELRNASRRIVTAKKLFNLREGWSPGEDTLPKRFLSEGLPEGTAPGAMLPRERLQSMIQCYYAARGYDANGNVPASLIQELSLQDLMTG